MNKLALLALLLFAGAGCALYGPEHTRSAPEKAAEQSRGASAGPILRLVYAADTHGRLLPEAG